MTSANWRLLLVKSALGDPRRAEANAARVHGILVTWNGVAIDHHTDDVQNARGLVAAQFGSVLADNAGAIDIDEVCVRAAERDAQSALGELVSHGFCIFESLCLELFKLLGLSQLES
jgi:hypothetical protein